MSRVYRGVNPGDIDEPRTRAIISTIDSYLKDLNAALGSIGKGEQPFQGGGPLPVDMGSVLASYLYLPGKVGGQTLIGVDSNNPVFTIRQSSGSGTADVLRVVNSSLSNMLKIESDGDVFIGNAGSERLVAPTGRFGPTVLATGITLTGNGAANLISPIGTSVPTHFTSLVSHRWLIVGEALASLTGGGIKVTTVDATATPLIVFRSGAANICEFGVPSATGTDIVLSSTVAAVTNAGELQGTSGKFYGTVDTVTADVKPFAGQSSSALRVLQAADGVRMFQVDASGTVTVGDQSHTDNIVRFQLRVPNSQTSQNMMQAVKTVATGPDVSATLFSIGSDGAFVVGHPVSPTGVTNNTKFTIHPGPSQSQDILTVRDPTNSFSLWSLSSTGRMILRDSTAGTGTTFDRAAGGSGHTLTWPNALPASSGRVLTSTSGGVLSWDVPTGGSFGTPSANSVGVSAPTAGVATTAIRTDATLQINQAITPTWTGTHTYHTGVVIDTRAETPSRTRALDLYSDTASGDADHDFMRVFDASTNLYTFLQCNTSIPSGTDVQVTLPGGSGTLVTASSLVSTRVPFFSTGGVLSTDSDLTFITDTLTATKIGTGSQLIANSATVGVSFADTTTTSKKLRVVLSGASASTNSALVVNSTASRNFTFPDADIIVAGSASALTSGRVPFATTGGLLLDDADMTFATDTLTVTKEVISTSLQVAGGAVLTALTAGVYTPTLTNVANLDSTTALECQYLRVGNTVTVSGMVTVDPTAATTSTYFRMTLPIASNLGTAQDLGGAGAGNFFAESVAISGDTGTDTALLWFQSATTSSHDLTFTFTYQVI